MLRWTLGIDSYEQLDVYHAVPEATFIAALGGAAVWPVAAQARQPAKTNCRGSFAAGTRPASRKMGRRVSRCRRLRELGLERKSPYRHRVSLVEGRDRRVVELAAEFVRLNVDVIVTSSSQAVKTVMKATSQSDRRCPG